MSAFDSRGARRFSAMHAGCGFWVRRSSRTALRRFGVSAFRRFVCRLRVRRRCDDACDSLDALRIRRDTCAAARIAMADIVRKG
ncbi:hypothetical protein [Burkholderia sp. MSMB1498]|uniref:hypothetical protein n=1 Tax=Burkholderia sp. MSMB1498 TaxID=1637842 RepID=UPI0018D25F93|nr:hypothetical protein [Burkholderia sp. MSMB1498]